MAVQVLEDEFSLTTMLFCAIIATDVYVCRGGSEKLCNLKKREIKIIERT